MSNTSATPANDLNVKAGHGKIRSTLARGVNFAQTHKKTTIAVVAIAGLVGANVLLEKKTGVSLVPDPNVEINTTENGFEVVDTSSN